MKLKRQLFLLLFLVVASVVAADNSARNLANGGFENGLKSWDTGWLHGKLDKDAHKGKSSLRMNVTKGKFSRLRRNLSVSKGNYYELTYWLKGKNCSLVAIMTPPGKRSRAIIPLMGKKSTKATETWTCNKFVFSAPADKLKLQLRAYSKNNGYILLDDVSILALGDVSKLPGGKKSSDLSIQGKAVNLRELAQLSSKPYLMQIRYLVDGDPETTARFQRGAETGCMLSAAFTRPMNITGIRFIQNGTATKWLIWGDTTGDGKFDAIVGRGSFLPIKGKKYKDCWHNTPIKKQKLYGIKLDFVGGIANYRSPYPTSMSELEIFTTDKLHAAALPKQDYAEILLSTNKLSWPELSSGNPNTMDIGVWADFFMMGLSWTGKNLPGDLQSYRPFKRFVANLKKLNANIVRIMPAVSCSKDKMPWISKICPDIGVDLLGKVTKALQAEGFKVEVMTHAWITPLQRRDPSPHRYGYPYEQADRIGAKYPCIISENDFRDKWLGILFEIAECGVDGIFISPDEHYYKGHKLSRTNCPPCQKNFKKMFGYDNLPKQTENTEKYRKWKIYEYTMLARQFQYFARELKKKYPHLKIHSSVNFSYQLLYNKQLEYGLAFDIFHKILDKDISFDGSPTTPAQSWDMNASAAVASRVRTYRKRKQFEQNFTMFKYYRKNPEKFKTSFISHVLSSVMAGSGRIGLYRYNYIYLNNWAPVVEATLKAVRLLQSWDILAGQPPAETCVLISRASEDWWFVKIDALLKKSVDSATSTLADRPDLVQILNRVDNTRILNFERFRGFYAQKSLEGLLQKTGIMYDARYLELALDNLSKYKLLIIPFAYSMSQKAYQAIAKAAKNGVKVLIYEMKGETNEYGVPYKKALLNEIIKLPNVSFVKTSLSTAGTRWDFRAANSTLIKKLLDSKWYFNTNGNDVEYLVNSKDEKNVILMFTNLSLRKKASAVAGVPLQPGRYKIQVWDSISEEISIGEISGAGKPPESYLKRFEIMLEPGQIKLLRIKYSGQ